MTERRRGDSRRSASASEPIWLDFVPIHHLEYVVDGGRLGRAERWLLLRPHRAAASRPSEEELRKRRRMIVVVRVDAMAEGPAVSLPETPPLSAGFNPYVDIPPA